MDFYRAQSVLSCLWLLLGILAYGVYTVALWSSQVTEQILVRSCAVLHFTLLVGVLAESGKGIADGELLLDNGFRICGSAALIDGEEARTKFRRSLTPQNAGSTQTLQTAPPCLRVPLKAPSGRVVSVDVCHVPLPNLYGTKLD
eukprot:s2272_g2.t1